MFPCVTFPSGLMRLLLWWVQRKTCLSTHAPVLVVSWLCTELLISQTEDKSSNSFTRYERSSFPSHAHHQMFYISKPWGPGTSCSKDDYTHPGWGLNLLKVQMKRMLNKAKTLLWWSLSIIKPKTSFVGFRIVYFSILIRILLRLMTSQDGL